MNQLSQICAVIWRIHEQSQKLFVLENAAILARDTPTASQASAQRALLVAEMAIAQEIISRFPAANDCE